MNYSYYRFTLDIQSNLSQVSLPVKLNDTGRRLLISLTDGGNPYHISVGSVAKFFYKKAERNAEGEVESGIYDCILEDNNSTIRFDLTSAVTNVAGVVDCEIRLYGPNGRLITTPRFIMVVDERVIYNDDVPMTDEQASTIDAIILAEEKRKKAESKRETAEKAREANTAEAIERTTERADEAIERANEATNRANEAADGVAQVIESGNGIYNVTGTGHTINSNRDTNHVSGKKHIVKDKVHKTTGTTVGGEGNTVEGVQNTNVQGKGHKVLGSDRNYWYGGSQSEISGLNHTIDASGDYGDCPNVHLSGEGNTARHRNVDLGGKGNTSSRKNQFLRGEYCNTHSGNTSHNGKPLLAAFGNGHSASFPSNAFAIYEDGEIRFGGGYIIDAEGRAFFGKEIRFDGGHFASDRAVFDGDVYANGQGSRKLATERGVYLKYNSTEANLINPQHNFEYRYGEVEKIFFAFTNALDRDSLYSFTLAFKSGDIPPELVHESVTLQMGHHYIDWEAFKEPPHGSYITLSSGSFVVPNEFDSASVYYEVRSADRSEYLGSYRGEVDISGWEPGATIGEVTFKRTDSHGENVYIECGSENAWYVDIYMTYSDPIVPFFIGADCIDGEFIPAPNKDYKLDVEWNGEMFVANVHSSDSNAVRTTETWSFLLEGGGSPVIKEVCLG